MATKKKAAPKKKASPRKKASAKNTASKNNLVDSVERSVKSARTSKRTQASASLEQIKAKYGSGVKSKKFKATAPKKSKAIKVRIVERAKKNSDSNKLIGKQTVLYDGNKIFGWQG